MDAREHVIVCGVDGSPAGRRALEWALDEAGRRNCRLRAVTAWMWDGMESMGAPASEREAREQAERRQADALDEAMRAIESPPEVERLLMRARPSDALTAAALDAELLVIGSHGHGAMHDTLVGSTSLRTLRHAACPVVVLHDPRLADRLTKYARKRRRAGERPAATPMF